MKSLKVKITFTEELLGTASNNPEIHDEFIASKAPDAESRAEEIERLGVGDVVEKSMTVFPRDENGSPILWSYQIEGFFKEACGALRKVSDKKSAKIKAYKKEIDKLVFVWSENGGRIIPILNFGRIGECQRPLRGQTAQGERIALARSETVSAGSYIIINIECLKDDLMAAVKEWLDYGRYTGIGQWRNSGKGSFTWEEVE